MIKRVLFTIAALSLFCSAFSGTYKPSQYTGTDSVKLQKACDAWAKDPGGTLDLQSWTGTLTTPVIVKSVGDRLSGRVLGNPLWWSITANFAGPVITFNNLKNARVECLSIRNTNAAGSGVLVTTLSSASSFVFSQFNFVGAAKSTGYALKTEGINGADVSGYTIDSCNAEGAGFVASGSNNLDGHYVNCRASYAKIGFDLRDGGSLSVLDHCGGSFNDETMVVNGGYPVSITSAWSELTGTLIRLGGDDAAGYGQTTEARISIADWRSGSGPTVVVNKSGRTVIDCVSGTMLSVKAENRNTPVPGKIEVVGAAMTVTAIGPFLVTGNVTVN